jgi:hypothetical protein
MKCAVEGCSSERIGPIWCFEHTKHQNSTVAPKLTWLSDREESHTDQWARHEQFTAHIQRVTGFWHFAVWTEAGPSKGVQLQGRTDSLIKAQELCEAFVRGLAFQGGMGSFTR